MSSLGTVLIAGHAPGLGDALKTRFAAGGYTVVGVSRRPGSRWATDLRDPGATTRLFRALDRQVAPLAGVVHNAMQFHRAPFELTSPQTLREVWESMVLTAFNVSQQAIPRLRASGKGCLIFSGASGSLRAGPHFAAFSSAKFALRGLSQAISREHAQHGIHVAHVVIDGLIRSQRTAERFVGADTQAMLEPADLAEQYWQLFHQPRGAWTHEIDVRPMPHLH